MNALTSNNRLTAWSPYRPIDHNFFFGRDRELGQLTDLILGSRLVLVHGEPGAGKTSLIHCALGNHLGLTPEPEPVPLPVPDPVPVPVPASVFTIRRGANVLDAWLDALTEHPVPDRPVPDQIEQATTAHLAATDRPLFFIFDSLEELFLFGTEREQVDFFRTLRNLRNLSDQLHFVLCCREAYLAHFEVATPELPDLMSNRFRVAQMPVARMAEVLVQMLTATGQPFSADFIAAFESVLQAEGKGMDLLLFQVYIAFLLDGIQSGQTLSAAHVAGRHSFRRAVDDFITQRILTLREPTAAFELLKRLVTPKGERLRIHPGDIARMSLAADEGSNRSDLYDLVKLDLVRHLPETDTYEVRHDAVARCMADRFSETDVARVRTQEFVQLAFQRNKGATLSDADLDSVTPFLGQLVLSQSAAESLDASFAARRARGQARLRTRRVLGLVGVLIGVFLGFIAVTSEMSRRSFERRSRALDLSNRVLYGGVFDPAKLNFWAHQAYEAHPSALSFEALMASAHNHHVHTEVLPGAFPVFANDTVVVLATDSGSIHRLRAFESPERWERMTGLGPVAQWQPLEIIPHFQPRGLQLTDPEAAQFLDYTGRKLDEVPGIGGFDGAVWGDDKELLGLVFEDSTLLRILPSGQYAGGRRKVQGGMDNVCFVEWAPEKRGIPSIMHACDQNEVRWVEWTENEVLTHRAFPENAEGECNVRVDRDIACLCAESRPDGSTVLVAYDKALAVMGERSLSDEEATFDLRSWRPRYTRDHGALTGFYNPNSRKHYPTDGSPAFGVARNMKQPLSNQHGDFLLIEKLTDAGMIEVNLHAQVSPDLPVVASDCIGWSEDGQHFLVGRARSSGVNDYEVKIFDRLGHLKRTLNIPLQPEARCLAKFDPSLDFSMLALFDQQNQQTHCLVFDAEFSTHATFKLKGALSGRLGLISPILRWDAPWTTAKDPLPGWLLPLDEGTTWVSVEALHKGRFFPSDRAHINENCPERLYIAGANGLDEFTIADGRMELVRQIAYPGLDTLGAIEQVQCGGEWIKLAGGTMLHHTGDRTFEMIEVPASMKEWTMTAGRQHVTRVVSQRQARAVLMTFADGLELDTLPLRADQITPAGSHLLVNEWGRSAEDSSRFVWVDLNSGHREAFSLPQIEGSPFKMEGRTGSRVLLSVESSGASGAPASYWLEPETRRLEKAADAQLKALGEDRWVERVTRFWPSLSGIISTERPDHALLWTSTPEGTFAPWSAESPFARLQTQVPVRLSDVNSTFRKGAYAGEIPNFRVSFLIDEASGSVLHLGTQDESCVVVDENYYWLNSCGLLSLRPRSITAVDAMFNNIRKP